MPFQSPYNEEIANKVNKINKKMLSRRKEPSSFIPDEDYHTVEGNYFNMGLPDDSIGKPNKRNVGSGVLSDIYKKGKKIYDTANFVVDEAKQFYKKPISKGLHYASKIADHYGYGRSGGNKYADRIPYFPAGTSGELGMLGNGSSGGKSHKNKNGAGIFGNIARGIGSVSDAFGLGKRKQKEGGFNFKFGDIARGVGGITDAFGLGKKRQKKSVHPDESIMVDRVNNRGQYGGRKPNKRAELVKHIMRQNGLSMIDASKFVKANNLYKP